MEQQISHVISKETSASSVSIAYFVVQIELKHDASIVQQHYAKYFTSPYLYKETKIPL